jgi:hypothetical protein
VVTPPVKQRQPPPYIGGGDTDVHMQMMGVGFDSTHRVPPPPLTVSSAGAVMGSAMDTSGTDGDMSHMSPTTINIHRIRQQYPHLSTRGIDMMHELTHLKHWLTDTARDTSASVDLVDMVAMREAVKAQQNFIEQLQAKRYERNWVR